MSNPEPSMAPQTYPATAAVLVLLTLTGVMLFALLTRTPPHPPLDVPPFAIGPFLGASLAIGVAAFHLLRHGVRHGWAPALVFALTALVSFGPQKYFDPAFPRIWPAVITAQLAVIVIVVWCALALRGKRPAA